MSGRNLCFFAICISSSSSLEGALVFEYAGDCVFACKSNGLFFDEC